MGSALSIFSLAGRGSRFELAGAANRVTIEGHAFHAAIIGRNLSVGERVDGLPSPRGPSTS
jgi:hypothetical protein